MDMERADRCPCRVSCIHHADCAACKDAHSSAGTKTACEKLGLPSLSELEARVATSGVKLLDFAPCAG